MRLKKRKGDAALFYLWPKRAASLFSPDSAKESLHIAGKCWITHEGLMWGSGFLQRGSLREVEDDGKERPKELLLLSGSSSGKCQLNK